MGSSGIDIIIDLWYNIFIMKKHPVFEHDTTENKALLELITEGYTVGAIRRKMYAAKMDISAVSDTEIINYMRFNRKIVEDRRGILDVNLHLLYGLAESQTRIRRLITFAEEIEPKALTDEKWATQYRQVLSQIRAEVEPYGLTIRLDDGWAKLLKDLANVDDCNTETA